MRSRWLSVVTIMFLVLPLLFPSIANAETKGSPHTSLKKSSLESTKSKINEKLQEQFAKQEQVTFLIKFKEQADPVKAAKAA